MTVPTMTVKTDPLRSMKYISCIAGLVLAGSLAAPAPGHAEIVINQAVTGKTNDKEGVVPPPGGEKETSRSDLLEFLNGDVLHGTFLSVDPKGGTRWQHAAIKQVVEINPGSISKIRLDRPKSTNATPRQICSVRLTNNDELLGELISLDDESLNLETWYAGSLNIPRKMIGYIAPGQAKLASIYEGPGGLEGWTVKGGGGGGRIGMVRGGGGGNSWKYANGAFFSAGNGTIGRDLKLPPLSNIEFDLSWRGYLQLAVSIYSDTLESYGGNSYMMQFNYSSVYMQRMTRNGESSSFGQVEIPAFNQKAKARVSLRSNKETKTISLLIDGAMVKQWTDRGEFASGGGLVFFQQGQGFAKISNLRVSEWDGKFEDQSAASAKSKEDLVKLANNDKISGALKTIKDGKMSFNTAFATLDVPIERVAQIELSGEKSDKVGQKAGDVRAVFVDRGTVTFQLERWDDQQVVGNSPNFGKVKFLPTAFTMIQFNLDKVKTPEGDAGDAGDLGPSDPILFDQ
jgi:hypothetical protein